MDWCGHQGKAIKKLDADIKCERLEVGRLRRAFEGHTDYLAWLEECMAKLTIAFKQKEEPNDQT